MSSTNAYQFKIKELTRVSSLNFKHVLEIAELASASIDKREHVQVLWFDGSILWEGEINAGALYGAGLVFNLFL